MTCVKCVYLSNWLRYLSGWFRGTMGIANDGKDEKIVVRRGKGRAGY